MATVGKKMFSTVTYLFLLSMVPVPISVIRSAGRVTSINNRRNFASLTGKGNLLLLIY